jgi:transcriptional regulator with XRE-family HTH domain
MSRSVAPDEDRVFASQVAKIVRDTRIGRGWSQEALARRAGLSTANVRRLENQPSPAMSFVTIGKLALTLGLPLDALFTHFTESHE